MSKRDKVLSLIGLAMKAGKCVSGETMTESETKSGKAKFVIVAGDASENTKKNSGICVSFIKFHFVSTEIKIPWGMQWEKSSVHLWRYLTKDLQMEFKES